MSLVDTHAHLNPSDFEAELAAVLARAHEAGVAQIVTIGITADSSAECVTLAERHPELFAAVGVQPNSVAQAALGDWGRIVELARHPRVVAIGETGLDRYWDSSPLDQQRDWFSRQMELARELDLPFVVHCRDAEADVLALLREAAARGPLRGVMHSYTGDRETMHHCLDLGLHISFAGMVTFTNKKLDVLRQLAAEVPDDRLLVETDSPYLSPHPLRGRPNEPAHLVHTVQCIAQLRGVTVEDLAARTTANARRLFRLPEPAT